MVLGYWADGAWPPSCAPLPMALAARIRRASPPPNKLENWFENLVSFRFSRKRFRASSVPCPNKRVERNSRQPLSFRLVVLHIMVADMDSQEHDPQPPAFTDCSDSPVAAVPSKRPSRPGTATSAFGDEHAESPEHNGPCLFQFWSADDHSPMQSALRFACIPTCT